jgi:hypothetical protein
LGVLGCEVPEELSPGVSDLGRRGGLVVGLLRHDVLVALAEVELIPQTGIDELITAAHEAEMRVVVASSDEEVLAGLPADDTIPGGDDLCAASAACSGKGARCAWSRPAARSASTAPISRSV